MSKSSVICSIPKSKQIWRAKRRKMAAEAHEKQLLFTIKVLYTLKVDNQKLITTLEE
jgi:hypothetical protein